MQCPSLRKLKSICKEEGLVCTGNRQELCERLLEHFETISKDSPESYRFQTEEYFTDLDIYFNKEKDSISYSKLFHQSYPGANTLEEIEKVTGIPLKILEKIYNKGLREWGNEHKWAMARVYSFAVKGCVFYNEDRKEAREAMKYQNAKFYFDTTSCHCSQNCL